MNEELYDLLFIISSVISSVLNVFIIIFICKIIIGFKKNCNLLNKGEI